MSFIRVVRRWLKRLFPFMPILDDRSMPAQSFFKKNSKMTFLENPNERKKVVKGSKFKSGCGFKTALEVHENPSVVDEIELNYTDLDYIPTSIGRFSNIRVLMLRNNAIAEIPWSVIYLKHLEVLDLAENSLTELPLIIGYLGSLKELYLMKNNLRYLPTSLLKLFRLEVLEVAENFNMESPPLSICLNGKDAIFAELMRRHERVNVMAGATPWYREENRSSVGTPRVSKVESLMKIAIDCIMECRVDYLAQSYVPPRLKTHLQTTENVKANEIKISACSQCKGYFSTEQLFDAHYCKPRGGPYVRTH